MYIYYSYLSRIYSLLCYLCIIVLLLLCYIMQEYIKIIFGKRENEYIIIFRITILAFFVFLFIRFNVHLGTIFSTRSFKKCIFQIAKVQNKSGCKVCRHKSKRNRRGTGVKPAQMIWYKRSCFSKKENFEIEKKKIKFLRKEEKICWLYVLCLV